MRVLVILNCSRRKSVDLGVVRDRLGRVPGFDLENEGEYRRALGDLIKPAVDMYDGPEFRVLRRFRECVDVFILSARYGIIRGERPIVPYEAYLGNADDSVLSRWARYGNWDLNDLISGVWDTAIVRLSGTYMRYFIKLIKDPCTLGREIHVIAGKRTEQLPCSNVVYHHVRGPGDAQSVLRSLLMRSCGSVYGMP